MEAVPGIAMPSEAGLILGEFVRGLDDRHRLSLPPELLDAFMPAGDDRCVVAKERAGCLSLWHADAWRDRVQAGIDLVKQKLLAHRLDAQLTKVQQFARLLSTRFRDVRMGERGRLVLPEGFREFLGVAPGGDVIVVGAAVCIELWHPDYWRKYLRRRMPRFNPLFDELSR